MFGVIWTPVRTQLVIRAAGVSQQKLYRETELSKSEESQKKTKEHVFRVVLVW